MRLDLLLGLAIIEDMLHISVWAVYSSNLTFLGLIKFPQIEYGHCVAEARKRTKIIQGVEHGVD
jgi:ABC-type dipeptide/oligopeptide/nickel transport system permease subunit